MRRILIIDNYDSFTFNLVQQMGALGGGDIRVMRNDVHPDLAIAYRPTHLLISPGPGDPSHTGISHALIEHFQGKIPILGVCLGLQLIGAIFGAQVVRAPQPVHGELALVQHDGLGIFADIPNPTPVARYHSLVLAQYDWPATLEISAWSKDGLVMGIRHRAIPMLEGVQFHPESFMSPDGDSIMQNFIDLSEVPYR